jgi:hypothetical protein
LYKDGQTESAAQAPEYTKAAIATSRDWSGAAARIWIAVRHDPDYILRAWGAILLLCAVDWMWAEYAGLQFAGFMPAVKWVAMMAALGFAIDYFGRVRPAAEAAHYSALWIAFAVSLVVYSYVVATLRMPLWDTRFERADLALGFNWAAGYDWIMSSSKLNRFILEHAYNSLMVQVFVSIGFFAIIGRADRNRELLWIGMLAVVLSVTLSGPFPAVGPYTTGGIPHWSEAMLKIRDGSVTKFTPLQLTGIVAFPSCHALMAVLLVYVHRPPLKTFWPVLVLNILMISAAPFAGHHYLVDLIAGSAMVAIAAPIIHAAMRPRSRARLERV